MPLARFKIQVSLPLSSLAFLSLWVTTPNDDQKTEIFSLRFITVANYGYEVATKIMLWLGNNTTWRTALKGHSIRKVENHWSSPSANVHKDTGKNTQKLTPGFNLCRSSGLDDGCSYSASRKKTPSWRLAVFERVKKGRKGKTEGLSSDTQVPIKARFGLSSWRLPSSSATS